MVLAMDTTDNRGEQHMSSIDPLDMYPIFGLTHDGHTRHLRLRRDRRVLSKIYFTLMAEHPVDVHRVQRLRSQIAALDAEELELIQGDDKSDEFV